MMVVFAPHSSRGCRSSATRPCEYASQTKIFSHWSEERLVSSVLPRPTPLALLVLTTAAFFFVVPLALADDVEPPEAAADTGVPPARTDKSDAGGPDVIVRCPSVNGGAATLAEIDARRRLAFVRQVMDDQAQRARTWTTAWMVAGLGLVVGNYTRAALVDDRDYRISSIVGGTTAIFIPAALLLRPLAVMTHQRTLETELVALSPANGASNLCAALAGAELLLARSAEDEAFQAGIVAHILAIGGNGAVALFLGLGFDNWQGALLNGGGGFLIREFQIYTQPTGAVTELARYRRGEFAPRSTSSAFPVRIVPWIAHGTAGLAAFGTF